MAEEKEFDVFISHASEDKREVALPLLDALRREGVSVWIDQQELALGDSLRGKISEGLRRSRYGIVILSPTFLKKRWPADELHSLLALEEDGRKRLLPIRYQMTQEELTRQEPLVGNRMSISISDDFEGAVAAILRVVKAPTALKTRSFAIDLSHGQRNWNHLLAFTDGSDLKLHRILRGFYEEPEALEQCSALFVPPPFHTRHNERNRLAGELGRERRWIVYCGMLCRAAPCDEHSELAWRFDFDLSDNLLMPEKGREADDRTHVFSRDPTFGVHISFQQESHPILSGVGDIALVSAASIVNSTQQEPDLLIKVPPDTVVKRPLGHIQPDGSRPNIEAYVIERQGTAAVFAARTYGRGRVAISGTWKICIVDFGDNLKFLRNTMTWLAGGEASVRLDSDSR
jgi:hypothetical protein